MLKGKLAIGALALLFFFPFLASKASDEKERKYFTDLTVIDQHGKALRFYSDVLKGRVVVISFIYTRCKAACPLTIQKLQQVKAQIPDLFGKEVFFVSISIDPEHDTPEDLRAFAEKLGAVGPGWIFLTGDKQSIETIVKRLGQYTSSVEVHSTLMLAGNLRTKHWIKLPPYLTPQIIALKVKDLAEEG